MPVCKFQQKWIQEFSWVQEGKEKQFAECTWCKTSFSFGTMGRSSIVSHAKGKKHKAIELARSKSYPMKYLLPSSSRSDSLPSSSRSDSLPSSSRLIDSPPPLSSRSTDSLPSSSRLTDSLQLSSGLTDPLPLLAATMPTVKDKLSGSTTAMSQSNLERFKIKDQVTESEIIWALHTVCSHNSLRNAQNAVDLFPFMFPDSDIAKNMRLHKDKLAYSVVYGLGYFFQQQLKAKLKKSDHIVVSFDESLNRVAQKIQMDVSIRYWDEEKEQVNTRYLTSEFLNHTRAADLFDGLKHGLEGLKLENILQLSMDGPNVNWALLGLLQEEMSCKPDSKKLLELGSCGLHTVHGAFKTGMMSTDWKLVQFFRAAFNLFKFVPARRGDFMEITKCNLFPLKFCNIRWIENSDVAKRCLELLPHLQTYVNSVKGTKKEPDSNSFKVVALAMQDKLLPAKIAFFQSLAEEFEPFLKEFQSDSPLVPFLYGALTQLMKNLMEHFVKKEILDKEQITRIDVMKKEDGLFVNLLRVKDINIGYGTRSALKKCTGVSQKDLLEFRKDVRKCLQSIVCKLLTKSPLKYPLTKALIFLNPTFVASSSSDACEHLRSTLEILIDCNIIPCHEAERVEREFKDLISQSILTKDMENYKSNETRVDDFWIQTLSQNPSPQTTEHLKKVVKLCLILSHGNSFVERGFSVNKEILVDNLTERSLIAQRVIYDSVSEAGGIKRILPLTKSHILAMRNAHSRFREAEEERRKSMAQKDKVAAEKRKATLKANELEEKKRKLMMKVSEEVSLIDEEIKQLKSH